MTLTTPTTNDRPIVCPQCQTHTTLANIRCPKCGVNLVLAVARAAREVLSTSDTDIAVPYEADKFLHRFGEFLLRQGDITSAQLEAALARQKSGSGQYRTVGQILLEMGSVNREQLDNASQAQMKETQTLLRESQKQGDVQAKRIKQLEATLGDLAQLNSSAVDVLASASVRLQAVITTLRASNTASELSTSLSELDALVTELNRFSSRDR